MTHNSKKVRKKFGILNIREEGWIKGRSNELRELLN